MAKTLALPKEQLVKQALTQMQNTLADNTWTDRQKLALTCRILFENGHDSGLAGQITARGPQPGTYYTQQLGLGFDEITASNLLLVNEDLEVLEGHGMPNPANRFHSWVYRARPDVNCIIHTHPTHVAALVDAGSAAADFPHGPLPALRRLRVSRRLAGCAGRVMKKAN